MVLALFYSIGGYLFFYIIGFSIMTGSVGLSALTKKSVDYLSDGQISLPFLTDTNPTIALSHHIHHEYDHVSPVNGGRGRRA